MSQDTTDATDVSPRREWLGVAWFTLLFVAAIGIVNGLSNQNLYLLYGLRLADPGFLPGDWFTWHTVPSHQAYGVLISLLARTPYFEWLLGAGVVVQNSIFALALHRILRHLYARPLLPWAATLLVFAALDTMSLGAAPWIKPFLGASTVSSVAMTLALLAAMERRWLLAGLALGAAGLFHAHFFVLALPALVGFSLALVWPNREVGWAPKLAVMWAAFLVISSPSIWQILRFTRAPGLDEIRWLTPAVFPYHVDPTTWGKESVVALAGGGLLGLGGALLRPPKRNAPLGWAMAFISAAVAISFLLARWQLLELASRTWPWRLSPLVLVAGLALGFAGVFQPTRHRVIGAGLCLLGWTAIVTQSRPPVMPAVLWAVGVAVVLSAGALPLVRARISTRMISVAGAALLTVGFIGPMRTAIGHSHIEFRPQLAERAPLYEWIRSRTPVDAVFAVPPSWEGFRINARRPIVVDWKAVPRYPSNRIEWLQRMEDLTGLSRPGSDRLAMDAAFAAMDCARARLLRERYSARYVVLPLASHLECGRVVHTTAGFCVYDLGTGFGPETAAGRRP